MSRIYFFAASIMLAFGALIFGPKWFINLVNEIGKDL